MGSSHHDFVLFSLKFGKDSDSYRQKPEELNMQKGTGDL